MITSIREHLLMIIDDDVCCWLIAEMCLLINFTSYRLCFFINNLLGPPNTLRLHPMKTFAVVVQACISYRLGYCDNSLILYLFHCITRELNTLNRVATLAYKSLRTRNITIRVVLNLQHIHGKPGTFSWRGKGLVLAHKAPQICFVDTT